MGAVMPAAAGVGQKGADAGSWRGVGYLCDQNVGDREWERSLRSAWFGMTLPKFVLVCNLKVKEGFSKINVFHKGMDWLLNKGHGWICEVQRPGKG